MSILKSATCGAASKAARSFATAPSPSRSKAAVLPNCTSGASWGEAGGWFDRAGTGAEELKGLKLSLSHAPCNVLELTSPSSTYVHLPCRSEIKTPSAKRQRGPPARGSATDHRIIISDELGVQSTFKLANGEVCVMMVVDYWVDTNFNEGELARLC